MQVLRDSFAALCRNSCTLRISIRLRYCFEDLVGCPVLAALVSLGRLVHSRRRAARPADLERVSGEQDLEAQVPVKVSEARRRNTHR